MLFYITLWILFSSSAVLTTKYILTALDFDFPFLLSCCHLFPCFIGLCILKGCTYIIKSVENDKLTLKLIIWQLLPIATAFSLSAVAINAAVEALSVSFVQMLMVYIYLEDYIKYV